MLYIYGSLLPLRILEEIRFWKEQEKEHTEVIKAMAPNLEQNYVKLLDSWHIVFTQTEQVSQNLLNSAMQSPHSAGDPLLRQIEQLLQTSFRQSQEFIRHLHVLMDQSAAIKQNELSKTVILHIIRESDYFLNVLERLNQPGAIAQNISGAPSNPSLEARSDLKLPKEKANIDPEVHNSPVPIGQHQLPPLNYPYNALEPYIDEQTMRIHHDKHHQSYVDGLNNAEKKLAEARKTGNFDLVKHWSRELAFNGAGHYLHTIFWDIMNPKGGGKPTGELSEQITKDFGSFEAFKRQFSEAAEKVEGGGWAILVWSPRSQHLEILQAEKHQNLSQWDVIPLLPLDVWEHAYYLKHQNNRKKYIEDWWNVVYWPNAASRYQQAKTLKWTPY
ncbi:Fe-Mn family superoxide dismutase [Paenibacillus sediminis]|uniref:superoxide dismutase n=1 Tax=Paenibacillus sediminis TaxID=664909 RepID=A0ABS4H656_9BACL|nr:Fe-Mn family superoxide dismutase [Paenibacillus sediminis]MBP1938015.1 Fe-Mn family superoxide dismutase [Paenibacillus sediminis]